MRERVAPECGCTTTNTISRGLCKTHYKQWLRTNPKETRSPSPRDSRRFGDFVDKSGECWIWTGPTTGKGYGTWSGEGYRGFAHRFALAVVTPPPSPDLMVCHKCDNPPCVRPDHLYWGTAKDNRRDIMERGRVVNHNVYKTHCKRGHELSGANLRPSNDPTPRRRCKICYLEQQRVRRAKKRAQRLDEVA